jgi:anaerobic C4-dicarboxylate transporter DcuB
MVYAFGLKPGRPPVDVMLTIIAVVAASATLQASGGLDVMLQIAEKILRRNPRFITILAPFTTCILTMLCGTGHVVYTMLPIIYDIAIKNDIRPERPMAASSISSQMGIMASPVSVAIVSLVAFLAKAPLTDGSLIGFVQLLSITIPSTLAGVLMIGIFSWFRGKDLDKDPDFQALIADPDNRKRIYGDTATLLGKALSRDQWTAMWIFLGAIAVVAVLGAFPELRPSIDKKPMNMVLTIQMFMLMAGAFILIFTKTDASKIGKSEVFRAGMIAVVAVFGIAWMADTMFEAHLETVKKLLAQEVQAHPWAYAIMLLVVSKFVNSQAAAVAALVPVACRSACIPATSPLSRRLRTATTSCRLTRATWRRSSSTAPARRRSASTWSTTASSCRG